MVACFPNMLPPSGFPAGINSIPVVFQQVLVPSCSIPTTIVPIFAGFLQIPWDFRHPCPHADL